MATQTLWRILTTGFRGWYETALDFVFPAECQCCAGFLGDRRVMTICASCWEAIPIIQPPGCPRCGIPYPVESAFRATPTFLCKECRTTAPFFDRAVSVGYYAGVLEETIKQFKFHHRRAFGRPLAQLMLTHLPPDLDLSGYHGVIPVPLHPKRQRERGYNQAAILAKELSRHLHLPLLRNHLRRVRPTEHQTAQTGRRARQQNVKDAFQVRHPDTLQNQDVILVDDIMTTGATANECAKTLKRAGARSVLVLSLSRRVLGHHR
jgi:competence protein ComFC